MVLDFFDSLLRTTHLCTTVLQPTPVFAIVKHVTSFTQSELFVVGCKSCLNEKNENIHYFEFWANTCGKCTIVVNFSFVKSLKCKSKQNQSNVMRPNIRKTFNWNLCVFFLFEKYARKNAERKREIVIILNVVASLLLIVLYTHRINTSIIEYCSMHVLLFWCCYSFVVAQHLHISGHLFSFVNFSM